LKADKKHIHILSTKLEIRRSGNRTVGSNPTPSANLEKDSWIFD